MVHESKLSARLDGGKTHGMVVVSKAVNMAIAKVFYRNLRALFRQLRGIPPRAHVLVASLPLVGMRRLTFSFAFTSSFIFLEGFCDVLAMCRRRDLSTDELF